MMFTTFPFNLRRPANEEERRLHHLLQTGTPEERLAEYDALQQRFNNMSQEEYDSEATTRLVCLQGLLRPE